MKFTLKLDSQFIGFFDSANEAADYAVTNFATGTAWSIQPLRATA